MKNYYRIMLGRSSMYAQDCFDGNFIGVDFKIHQDLSGKLPDNWRSFNKEFIPIYQQQWPDSSKIKAGLACGAIWTVAKGIFSGEIVLCPDGTGSYRVGEVTGDYYYAEGQILPHRRPVRWLDRSINREEMSEPLRRSTCSIGTHCMITKHADELEKLLAGIAAPTIIATDDEIEDPSAFAMEKHLEDFLVQNWPQTELAKEYKIFEDDGEPVGQQYPTDTGPIDILAVSNDGKTLLVVELKRGRASDAVVGQILRYMGFVHDELAEENQAVRGLIIALKDDPKLQRALSMVDAVDFYRYSVSFKLMKT